MAHESNLKPIAQESELEMASHHVSELKVWNFFMGLFNGNEYAAAGACGNMQWESGLYSDNAENSWNKKFGLTDEWLTEQINTGQMTLATFLQQSWWVNNYGFGYGLSQWTDTTRRTKLWNDFTIGQGYNIDDEDKQLDYIEWEFTSPNSHYSQFRQGMIDAQSIHEATVYYLNNYEIGAWNDKREEYAKHFYYTYGSSAGLSIQTGSTGNGTISVSDRTPQAGDTITLRCIPAAGETLLDIEARIISSGQAMALSVTEIQTFPMPNESVYIFATFSGTTPPTPYPPQPYPPYIINTSKSMPIWEYPVIKNRRKYT